MTVRITLARPKPGTTGETRRVVHSFPEPEVVGAQHGDMSSACGETFPASDLEILAHFTGMPCIPCMIATARARPPAIGR